MLVIALLLGASLPLASGQIPKMKQVRHAFGNNPPEKPQQPDGPTGGIIFNRVVVGNKYTYTTVTTDPDGDEVTYLWDWGDNTTSGWSPAWPSGVGVSGSHTWTTAGTYEVKVKARDAHDAESDWSDPLVVTVRNKLFDGSCFLAGTQVTMADGSYKDIKAIAVGDSVLSYNMATDVFETATVTKVYHHTPLEMDGSYLIINGNLQVTSNHLLYVHGELVQAGEVCEGDTSTVSSTGGASVVTSIRQAFGWVPTYNFELETSTQLYFVDGIPAYPFKPGSNQHVFTIHRNRECFLHFLFSSQFF